MRQKHHKDCPEWNKKKPRYKLSPNLCDGEHWTVADTGEQVLEAVRGWAENADFCGEPDDGFEVGIAMMSDKEVEELPDI